MSDGYRVVKLLKNRLYPTYQLHAFMANDATDPHDGLRLAALTAMRWLKARLGGDLPEEWRAVPPPEEYLNASDADLPSLYVNQGHVVNVVSLPEEGMWTLMITEPDLGSDPGNPEQSRAAVPGRIIETNVAFRVVGRQLECGFSTVISDPVGTEPMAEVYRIAVVRELMRDPAFGLKQVAELLTEPTRLTNASQIKTMLFVVQNADNSLPTVVFTQPAEEKKAALPDPSALLGGGSYFTLKPKLGLPGLAPAAPVAAYSEPKYDLERFCYYTFSHCRTYILEAAAGKSFAAQTGISFDPGDAIVLYPTALGGGSKKYPCMPSAAAREKTVGEIEADVKNYLRDRPIGFGSIEFLSGARERMLRLSGELQEDAEAADARFRQEIERLNAEWKGELARRDREAEALNDQLQRQKEYSARLESDKTQLREDFIREEEALRAELAKRDATVDCLLRKCDRPRDYDGIPAWVERHFDGKLILHPHAVSRMLTKSNQCANVQLVCDALDYLATDYWEQRWEQLPKETALMRCGEKYGRPFEIAPIGQMTIDFTPSEYRVKYFKDARGRECDSDLNWHLRVGNDSENLLRVYFLHDDEKRLIVVGSLPDHLRSVTIK